MINGFKKELIFFARGGRLAAVILVMLALAVMSPLMFGMMSGMLQTMQDAMPDNEQYTQMIELFTSFSASDMLLYTIEYVGGIGAIVMLFLLKGSAGGEQKKRSVIIPQCAGLTPEGYVLPKFIIYPACLFVITFLAVLAGAGVSVLMFPGGLKADMVVLAAVCTGVFLAFSTAMQFCIGICSGSSNAAVVAVLILQTILPSILSFFRVDRFNPFALTSISYAAASAAGESGSPLLASLDTAGLSDDISTLNVTVSLATAVIIAVLLCFLTIFVMHTKEVHNEGNEPVL